MTAGAALVRVMLGHFLARRSRSVASERLHRHSSQVSRHDGQGVTGGFPSWK
jgi:hypothetical protein